ncbi:MAG: hypothetical protein GX202_09410 [Firmicutes bacterium]|nr:hypothetical protein [Bacillota bacterium]
MPNLKNRAAALLVIAGLFFFGGCLPKPYLPGQDLGRLCLQIRRAETPAEEGHLSTQSQPVEIERLVIRLTNNKAQIQKAVHPYREGEMITIESLYPGTWKVQVFAYDNENKWQFYGEEELAVPPGATVEATLVIGTAPGWVNVALDITALAALGLNVEKGRFYVHEDPASDQTTDFDLVLSGNKLVNKDAILIKAGTYESFIAVPNKSNPVYKSHYHLLNIEAGETVEIVITADASLCVTGRIDANPPTPKNFQVNLIDNQPELCWDPVAVADLAGYNIYRTNSSGRFVLHRQVSPAVNSYRDQELKAKDFFNNRIGYAVSSFDAGGNNSIWACRYLYLPLTE